MAELELMKELIACGKELGLQGETLQKFVADQQKAAEKKEEKRNQAEEKRSQSEEKYRQEDEKRRQDDLEREERKLDREMKMRQAELDAATAQKKLDLDVQQLAAQNPPSHDTTAEFKGRKHQKLSHFDTKKDDLDAYLIRFEAYAENCEWPEPTWAMNLGLSLKGQALEVYSAQSAEDRQNYTRSKTALMKSFNLTEEGFRKKFLSCKPSGADTWQTYHSRISNLLNRWIDMSGIEKTFDKLYDLLLREQIISVFNDDLRVFIRERTPKSTSEIIRAAESFREARCCTAYDLCVFDASSKYKPGFKFRSARNSDTNGKFMKLKNGKLPPPSEPTAAAGLFNPGKPEQKRPWKSKFPKNGPDPPTPPKQGKSDTFQPKKRCFNCQSREHFLKECPHPLKAGALLEEYSSDEEDQLQEDDSGEESAACIPVDPLDYSSDTVYTCAAVKPLKEYRATINGQPCTAIRDTGLTSIVVREKFVQPEQYTGKVIKCKLMDNSIVLAREAVVDIDCKFYRGNAKAMVMKTPISDLAIGNVANLQDFDIQNLITVKDEVNHGLAVESDPVDNVDTTESPVIENPTPDISAVSVDSPTSETLVPESSPSTPFLEGTELSQAVVTRNQAKKAKKPLKPLKVPAPIQALAPGSFKQEQESDPTLSQWWNYAKNRKSFSSKAGKVSWEIKDGLLYRIFTEPRELERTYRQLAVPSSQRLNVLKIAHDTVFGGHLGVRKTAQKVKSQFYWPGIDKSTKLYGRSCDKCQKFEPKGRTPRAHLGTMPIIDQPFRKIAVDLVGPLKPMTDSGHQYILTIIDYATRYPEAIALKKIDTETVAEALLEVYSRVGIPEEVLSDLGSQFVSDVMTEVSRLLSIRRLTTTPYHAMCNGLVEKFNGTLKSMLKKLCAERPKDWQRFLSPLLFAYREAPHASCGFSPFEMMYGWPVRGLLEAVRELWSDSTDDPDTRTSYQYVLDLRDRLSKTCDFVKQNLKAAQAKYKMYYDRKARTRTLKVGESVLLLLPTDSSKLLMSWKGPFKVLKKIGELDYKIDMNGRTQTFHINMMKKYVARTPDVLAQIMQKPVTGDKAPKDPQNRAASLVATETVVSATCIGVVDDPTDVIPTAVAPKETLKNIDICGDLERHQSKELWALLLDHGILFSDVPSRTSLLVHNIRLTSATPFRKKQYPVPFSLIPAVKREVQAMLDLGVIEPSNSPYSSPYLMLRKPDSTTRFCVDLRDLNSLTIFDAEPMPDVELMFTKFQGCKYFTELDMTKGYWQLPLAENAKQYTAFATPVGHFQFNVMPFGCQGGPSSFSRLMRLALGEIEGCQNFMDNIVISTKTWEEHMSVLKLVLERMQKANLCLRPSKCHIGFPKIQCLGYMVDGKNVWPISSKIEPIQNVQKPRTKKLMKKFLGFTGFYQKFIPRYSDLTAPLSDKTKKSFPNKLHWSQNDEKCFDDLKNALMTEPILVLPDFTKCFYVGTDASGTAVGAVLLQEHDDMLRPVAYASKKLNDAETRYSTIERECLAIVWAIGKFCRYLYGRRFVVLTDHKPLQFLKTNKQVNSRLMRWSLALQPFDFTIKAIKGSDNVGPDFLSRMYED